MGFNLVDCFNMSNDWSEQEITIDMPRRSDIDSDIELGTMLLDVIRETATLTLYTNDNNALCIKLTTFFNSSPMFVMPANWYLT